MGTEVMLSKEEYDELAKKAALFDQYIETEEITRAELKRIKLALQGPFLTKSEFLKRHPDVA